MTAADGCVVFFTRTADAEVSELARLLTLLGVPVRRIDADALGPVQVDPAARAAVRVGGRVLRPTVSWTRRFWPSAMPPGRAPADVLYRDTWLALGHQLAGSAPVALPGPRLGLLDQLTDAAASGVRVPATVVGTDLAAAAARLPGDRLVVKVVGAHFVETEPGVLHGFLPRILPRAEVARPGAASRIPLVVQEYVPHEAEYRVYAAGGALVAFRVRKPSPDAIWRDPDAVEVRPVDAPERVARAVRGLAARWGLGYGAFDMLATESGPVFLEVNHDGDWRWYERRAGVRSVSRTLALLLRDRHAASDGAVARPRHGLLALMTG
ncbi:MAG TPA: hypothetical protein VGL93_14055 [Streptosporangiaceae bacterium]